MKPPAEEWGPWVYRAAMMLIGAINLVSVIWLHWDLTRGPWPVSTAMARLEWLFWLGLCNFALLGLQMWGLVARNLVRARIKAKVLGNELEVE